MKRALSECVIEGVTTTAPYHMLLLSTDDFKKGNVDTGFISKHEEELATPPDDGWNVKLVRNSDKSSKSKQKNYKPHIVRVMG